MGRSFKEGSSWGYEKKSISRQKTGFKYSRNSVDILATCHNDIRDLMMLLIKISPFDIKITSGYRTPEEQYALYLKGNSKLDGTQGNTSKHNHWNVKKGKGESKAVDFLLRVRRGDEYIWKYAEKNYQYYTYIWGLLDGYDPTIHEKFRWGGDWDRDYEFYTDHKLKDPYHIEMRR